MDVLPPEDRAMGDDAAAKAQTRAHFDLIAPDYDLAGCFAHFGRRLVGLVGVEPGQRVLDVATGRGAVLLPAAERVGAAGEAVGIDLSGEMARAAGDEAARRGLAARVEVMDAERLDFPDAAFDRVLCGFAFMFFPHLDRALGEMRRVLKPGGRLGVSTWRATHTDDLAAVLAQLGLADPAGDPALRLREPDDLERALAAAGFAGVRVLVEPASIRYADLDQYWQNARGTRLRRWLDRLDAAQLERARAALADRLRPQQRADGIHVNATALLAVAGR
jgi:ubiquinone/menaquinone biosynthesis C-methylase UbiE